MYKEKIYLALFIVIMFCLSRSLYSATDLLGLLNGTCLDKSSEIAEKTVVVAINVIESVGDMIENQMHDFILLREQLTEIIQDNAEQESQMTLAITDITNKFLAVEKNIHERKDALNIVLDELKILLQKNEGEVALWYNDSLKWCNKQ